MAKYETLAIPNNRSSDFDSEQADRMRHIWLCVILRAVEDACGGKIGNCGADKHMDAYARRWLTTLNDDFIMAFTFAGINPAIGWAWVQKMEAEGWPWTMDTIKQIRRMSGLEARSTPRMREVRAA